MLRWAAIKAKEKDEDVSYLSFADLANGARIGLGGVGSALRSETVASGVDRAKGARIGDVGGGRVLRLGEGGEPTGEGKNELRDAAGWGDGSRSGSGL